MKPPRAAVLGVADPLDQPRFLEPVDDPAQGDRLEIEHVGKLDLAQAGRAGQLEQHLPLRARDSEPDREAVERLAQRMRGLADLEGKVSIGYGYSKRTYIKQLSIAADRSRRFAALTIALPQRIAPPAKSRENRPCCSPG